MTDNSGLDVAEEFLRTMVDESRVSAAEEFVSEDASVTINGVEYGYEEYVDRLETSDQQFDVTDVEIRDVVGTGTTIALKHDLELEHRGAAFGVQPNYERFLESSASFLEIDGGVIRAIDITYDPTATLEELGLLSSDPTTEKLRDQYYEILNRVLRHNLRNKLNIILASTELVEDDPETATTKISEQTTELLTTVEKAQKIEQMAIDAPLEPTRFVVSDAIDDVLGQFERRHELTDRRRYPEQAPELTTDKRLFQNVLDETLQNAILYSETDTPEVTVTLERATEEGYAVELTIEDGGPGIPESELEPLRQDRETKLLHGSGIGLWIIKWCVTRLGGRIDFESDETTTVRVALPDMAH